MTIGLLTIYYDLFLFLFFSFSYIFFSETKIGYFKRLEEFQTLNCIYAFDVF